MADRYGYMPIVGIFIMAVWGAGEMLAGRPGGNWAGAVFGCLAIGGCAVLTTRQARVWENTFTLFVHTSEVTADNYDAFYQLGRYWQHKGETARAAEYYNKSLQINPDFAQAHNNLGYILLQDGKAGEAIAQFEAALRSQPVYPEASYNLGRAHLTNGQPGDAAVCFQKALGMDPNVAEINYSLGEALRQQGLISNAVAHYERALELRPDSAPACNNLAWLLATCPAASIRDGPLAVALAKHAEKLTSGRDAVVLGTLAAAQAEAGNFAEAMAAARRAQERAAAQTNTVLAKIIAMQQQQYGRKLPWRDPTQAVKEGSGK
jgi:Tfp pilus assembly protein PilF